MRRSKLASHDRRAQDSAISSGSGVDVIKMTGTVKDLFATRWRVLHAEGWADDATLRYPGVYLLAYTAKDIAGQKIRIDDVYYVGMSNSAGGVRARLRQFKSALEKGCGHSAGNHCFAQNRSRAFSGLRGKKAFFFTSLCVPCSGLKSSGTPEDFRKMGFVACLEYYAIAHVLAHGAARKVPPLNRSAGGVLTE